MTHDKTARLSFAPNNTEPQIQGKLWILFIKTPFDLPSDPLCDAFKAVLICTVGSVQKSRGKSRGNCWRLVSQCATLI